MATDDPGKVASLTLEVLIKIREEIAGLRTDLTGRIDETNAQLGKLEGKVDRGFAELKAEIAQTNTGIDGLRGALIDHATNTHAPS